MDAQILNNIINSSITNETSNKCQTTENEVQFPVTKPDEIDGLSKIFTKLLSYKVSEKAYQRYAVRLQLIDTLRDWSQVKGDIGSLPIFKDSEKSYNLLISILKKYLSKEVLNNCDDVDNLIQLAELLLNALMTKRSFMKDFIKVIDRILMLEQTEKSKKFLLHIIEKNSALKLGSFFIEKIYLSQKTEFIEKAFSDSFVEFCSNENNKESLNKMDLLFENVVHSPSMFQLISNQLKEFFVKTKYVQVAQNFIQSVLHKIEVNCSKYNKDVLELYPTNLQFCVILLKINPRVHTLKSKNHTVQSLKEIFLKNYNDALILVSHFPEWLPEYLNFFNTFDNCERLSQDSDIQIVDEIVN